MDSIVEKRIGTLFPLLDEKQKGSSRRQRRKVWGTGD
jgi:hypothetical protein